MNVLGFARIEHDHRGRVLVGQPHAVAPHADRRRRQRRLALVLVLDLERRRRDRAPRRGSPRPRRAPSGGAASTPSSTTWLSFAEPIVTGPAAGQALALDRRQRRHRVRAEVLDGLLRGP